MREAPRECTDRTVVVFQVVHLYRWIQYLPNRSPRYSRWYSYRVAHRIGGPPMKLRIS